MSNIAPAYNDRMLAIYVSLHQINDLLQNIDYEPNVFTDYLRSINSIELPFPKLPVFLNLLYSTPFSSSLDEQLAACKEIVDGKKLRRISPNQVPKAILYLKSSGGHYEDFMDSQRLFV